MPQPRLADAQAPLSRGVLRGKLTETEPAGTKRCVDAGGGQVHRFDVNWCIGHLAATR